MAWARLISSIRLDLLEVLGDEYISQHIYNERYKEMVDLGFKVYVTDALKAFVGMENRWYSSIENLEKPKSKKNEKEIKDKIKAILNGEVNK